MKAFFSLGLIGIMLMVGGSGRVLANIGLLPDDKKPTLLNANERNPFGAGVSKGPTTIAAPKETEETRLRTLIARLPLSGITRSYGKYKALMGPYILKEGRVLPPLISHQTEEIKVLSINDQKVQLGFVEKDGSADKRTIDIDVDLEPVVHYQLSKPPTQTLQGIDAPNLEGVYRKEP